MTASIYKMLIAWFGLAVKAAFVTGQAIAVDGCAGQVT
jgi:hypothetical protein